MELTKEAYTLLANLVSCVLEFCDNDFDVWNARSLMVLSQRFYAYKSDSGDQVFLQARLHGIKLWDRVDFWEETVAVTIAEEMMYVALSRRSDFREDQMPPLQQGLLEKLCPSMNKFGIDKERVRSLFTKVYDDHASWMDRKVLRRLLGTVDGASGCESPTRSPTQRRRALNRAGTARRLPSHSASLERLLNFVQS